MDDVERVNWLTTINNTLSTKNFESVASVCYPSRSA